MYQDSLISRVKPPLTRPDDFDDFWSDTLEALDEVLPAPEVAHRESRGPLRLDRLRFASLGGARIDGYLLSWTDARRRPLVVHAHGYNHQYEIMWRWAEAGMDVVGFDARGFGRSAAAAARHPGGWVLTGIDAPAASILRGAVMDYVRACRVARALLGSHAPRTIFCGSSFAGGLALMAAAVSGDADLLAVGVPTFGWAAGRRKLAHQGSSAEINAYLAARPDREPAVMATLAYLDPMNHADRIRCPALVGVGQRDAVVPAATVYAIINHMRCFHEVREFPVSHSQEPEEALWAQFEAEWLGLVRHGIATDFGRERVRRIS